MTRYLISFPSAAMDHIPAEEFPAVGEAAHAVAREAMDAGVWVFGGGLSEDVDPVMVAGDGTISVGTYSQAEQFDGGFAVLDLPSREAALEWAAKLAAARHSPTKEEPVPAESFAQDIRHLFRDRDINSMSFALDLSSYDEVRAKAEAIYERLAAGTMLCDGRWPDDDLQRFRAWIGGGSPPRCLLIATARHDRRAVREQTRQTHRRPTRGGNDVLHGELPADDTALACRCRSHPTFHWLRRRTCRTSSRTSSRAGST